MVAVASGRQELIVGSGAGIQEATVSRKQWEEDRDRALSTKDAFWDHVEVVTRIRDTGSYKHEYRTYDEFCEQVLGISRDYANKLGRSVQVRKNLELALRDASPEVKTIVFGPTLPGGSISIPDNEAHLREISKAPVELRPVVAAKAQSKAKAEGREPTAKDYRNAVVETVGTKKKRKPVSALPVTATVEAPANTITEDGAGQVDAPSELPPEPDAGAQADESSIGPAKPPLAERYVDDLQQEVPESLRPAWRSTNRIKELACIISDHEASRAVAELISLGKQLESDAMVEAGYRARNHLGMAANLVKDAVPAVVEGETFLTKSEADKQYPDRHEAGGQVPES